MDAITRSIADLAADERIVIEPTHTGRAMQHLFLSCMICSLLTQLSIAQMQFSADSSVVFATVDEGKQILTSTDDFVERMSPFDRAARMKTDQDVSQQDYLDFVGKNVLAWTEADKQAITASFQSIQPKLAALSLPFPERVLLIKTTGNEEGNAAYTRASAIVFPAADLNAPGTAIQQKICHELFHVLSRANPELRERLYSAVGFVKCDEVEFPSDLRMRKITNPDAPKNDHCIRLKVDGTEHWAIPILFSRSARYDMNRGGEFFNYLEFQFLIVERDDNSSDVHPLEVGQKPMLVGIDRVGGFFEQVGNNTRYIIHPEEILADNFALLVLQKRSIPSPEVISKMTEILREARTLEEQVDSH